MSTRYLTGAVFALLGGFALVISQALAPAVLGWAHAQRAKRNT